MRGQSKVREIRVKIYCHRPGMQLEALSGQETQGRGRRATSLSIYLIYIYIYIYI